MIVAGPSGYVDGTSIREAPVITFLWVHTFPLKVYGPAVLPMLAVYISLAMEATCVPPSCRDSTGLICRCQRRHHGVV